ncbi:glycine betaine ABC transporter substrate-binding protein [Mycobacterium spongiae]|uniref:ABC-type glycine betaine transport system substrate-binding domain-containing protein n=1 Tax=Mycobacterium spongiae TaxID=886343 RepID=A0A975PXQ8_9MYCO|nr:glycine betaine ABC transporter substrate-binding protein [Mycobacterium spongiae]QUR68516.1 hypothetical protein F6B93_16780 [Mycobacterium spongiae]
MSTPGAVSVGRLVAPLLVVAALVVAGCDAGGRGRAPELVVGSAPASESILLADVYVAALRSYGFAARAETAGDPMSKLDSGEFIVVPAFTGQVLQALQPGAGVLSDALVYRAMVAALPEGIAAGDYTTAAEDKPALVVTEDTAMAWGSGELAVLPRHCDGLVVGRAARVRPPARVGSCTLPPPHEYSDSAVMFAALRGGELTVAWTSTAAPDTPDDLVVLADGRPALVQAQNVVPLYRRNELNERQLLAINEVAGVLDTAALIEMRRQVSAGAKPQAVADEWLGEHPLGK